MQSNRLFFDNSTGGIVNPDFYGLRPFFPMLPQIFPYPNTHVSPFIAFPFSPPSMPFFSQPLRPLQQRAIYSSMPVTLRTPVEAINTNAIEKKFNASGTIPISTLSSINSAPQQSNITILELLRSMTSTNHVDEISQAKKLDEKVIKKLNDLKILPEKYVELTRKLQGLGYHITQCDSIILRKSSSNTIITLINLHDELIKNLTHEQIIKIANQHGGSENLAAVKENIAALKKLGFTIDHIVKTAAQHGGSKNLAAVKENVAVLKELNFTADHIIKIAAHHGGSKNLAAVKENVAVLKELNFTADHIIKMAAHHGGSKNLAAVKENIAALKELGFTADHIIRMARHDGASSNLAAVKENVAALKELGFTADHIVKIAAHHGGSKNLAIISHHQMDIHQLKLSPDEIANLVTNNKARKYFIDSLNLIGLSLAFTDELAQVQSNQQRDILIHPVTTNLSLFAKNNNLETDANYISHSKEYRRINK